MKLVRQTLHAGLLAIACSLPAQTPAPDEPVTVEFSLYAWQTDLPTLRYSKEAVIAPLEASTRSPSFSYTGPATLRFYPVRAKLETRDEKLPPAIASVTFPPGATRFTIVTISRGGGRYRMQALAENGDLLPPRFVQLHNFTDTRLLITYGQGNGVQIPANGSAFIRPSGNATVIHVSHEENGSWRKLFNNVVELNADGRANIILAAGAGRPISLFNLPAWPVKTAGAEPAESPESTPAEASPE